MHRHAVAVGAGAGVDEDDRVVAGRVDEALRLQVEDDALRRLFGREYIVEQPAADTVGEIIRTLEAGKHVILSFHVFDFTSG